MYTYMHGEEKRGKKKEKKSAASHSDHSIEYNGKPFAHRLYYHRSFARII